MSAGGSGGSRPALLLFGALALLRVAYAIEAASTIPVLQEPLADSVAYRQLARAVAAGALLQDEPFYRAPLYPYLLAPAYALHGRPEAAIALAQVLLGIGSLLLVWRIARNLWGERGGVLAMLLWGLFAPAVSQETKILPTALGTFLGLVSLALLIRARDGPGWGIAGAALGLSALVRPGLLLLAPFPPLIARRGRGRAAVRLSAYAAGIVLALLPATLHNLHAGDLVLISSNGGITFYHGNNRENRSGLPEPGPLLGEGINAVRQAEIDRDAASRWAGRPLSRSEASAFWFRAGIEDLARDPAGAARLWGRKLLRFVSIREVADIYSPEAEREQVRMLRLFPFPFALLLALAAAGLLLRPPRTGAGRLVLLFALAGLAVSLLFHAGGRYRMESAPACAILAGSLLAAGAGVPRRRALAAAGGFGVVAALSLAPAGPAAREREAVAAAQWAGALERAGREEEAIGLHRLAVRRDPAFAVSWGRMGILAGLRGGPEAEIPIYDEGIVAGADGPLLRRQRGHARFSLGLFEEAARDFRAALAEEPGDPFLRLSLAVCLVRSGEDGEARALLREEPLARDPVALRYRGLIAARAGRWEEAAELLDLSGGADPVSELLRTMADLRLGRPERARARLEKYGAPAAVAADRASVDRLLSLLRDDPGEGWPSEAERGREFPEPIASGLAALESLWRPSAWLP